MVRIRVSNVESQKPTWKTLVLAELLLKEMRKMVAKTGEWPSGDQMHTREIKNKGKKTRTNGMKAG